MTPYAKMRVTITGDHPTWEEQHNYVAMPAGQALKDRMDALAMVMDNPKDRPQHLVKNFMQAKRHEYAGFPQVCLSSMGGGDPEW